MSTQILNRPASPQWLRSCRRLLGAYGIFSVMAAAGTLAIIMIIPIGVSYFRPIEASGWDLAQQLINWFALGIAAHIGFREFWLYVTHGGTRRDFFAIATVFAVAFTLLLSILYALGFWIEAPLYALMGWPQAVHEPLIFREVLDSPAVVLETWPSFLLWAAAGVAIGACFYRSGYLGAVAIGVGLFAAQITSLAMGRDAGPVGALIRMDILPREPNIAAGLFAHALCIAALLALAWFAMRDAPIHNKKS
jgi:hypothetical protein